MIGNLLSARFTGKMKWSSSFLYAILMWVTTRFLAGAISFKLLAFVAILLANWAILKHGFGVKNPIIVMVVAFLINLALIMIVGSFIVAAIGINFLF